MKYFFGVCGVVPRLYNIYLADTQYIDVETPVF